MYNISIRSIAALLLTLLTLGSARAFTVRDTIFTTDEDRIIVKYEVTVDKGKCTIAFDKVQRRLNDRHEKKYGEHPEKVFVLLFERTGSYGSTRFEGMMPVAFMTPNGMTAEPTEQGFYRMNEQPTLNFTIKGRTPKSITLPLFIGCQEKKGRYQLFAQTKGKGLVVPLTTKESETGSSTSAASAKIIDAGDDAAAKEEKKITDMCKDLTSMLEDQEELPMDPEVEELYSVLRQKKYDIEEEELLKVLENALTAYRSKKKELEANAKSSAAAAAAAAKAEQEEREAEMKAQQDSIATVQAAEAKKKEKQTLWMIIGGGLLAVLGFAGNQILQHFRMKSSQLNMANMQQQMANKAKAEAERMAKEQMDKATHQALGKMDQTLQGAKKKANEAFRPNPNPSKPRKTI